LNQLLGLVRATRKTNAFCDDRYALALRLEPHICMNPEDSMRTTVPFGVYFVSGLRFQGFHVRFRDIARGGLRMVTPGDSELLSIESGRHFNECYDLAYAQQLKNKDIAEGGSKAVCIVNNLDLAAESSKDLVLRRSVKAFANSILDLTTKEENTTKKIVDHLGKDELIYLGPDEQIIPEDLLWIIERAEQRGYGLPRAFMSSKPDAGINHKVYGVTSEGVNVFLDVALQKLKNMPKPFTVKLTGGPDGDVAGNMLKIMHREYGDDVKVVGLADGTASLEDPEGLNMEELLRLFYESKPLIDYDSSKLSSVGILADADTNEGLSLRNTMHNRVKADAFVPAGGRPGTINESNWKSFIGKDGKPSSSLIVEGANLFITPGARKLLQKEAGCVIVKDSSANKCGVICSAYEIMASMLLSKDEFLNIKEELVEDVLVCLRDLARLEAELLFRTHLENPDEELPLISQAISSSIIKTGDLISTALEGRTDKELLEYLEIVKDRIPKKLVEESFDRFSSRIPTPYTRELVASLLANDLVYREGINYADGLSAADADVVLTSAIGYASRQKEVEKLAAQLEEGETLTSEQKSQIAKMILRGGARVG